MKILETQNFQKPLWAFFKQIIMIRDLETKPDMF